MEKDNVMSKRMTFLTRADEVGSDPYDSIAWAHEVHLKQPDMREYNSAVLYGNEDCPTRIDFYRTEMPSHTAPADKTWLNPEYAE